LKFSFSFKLSFKQNGDEIVVYFKIFLVWTNVWHVY
jgi:hypothetical protein